MIKLLKSKRLFTQTLNNHKRAIFTTLQVLSCAIPFKSGDGCPYNQNGELGTREPFHFPLNHPLEAEDTFLVYKHVDLSVHRQSYRSAVTHMRS